MVQPALRAMARGAPLEGAAALVGVGSSTIQRRVQEEGVVMLRARAPRPGALTLDEREEIRAGIERGESDAEIAERIGKHRCTVWREIRDSGGRRHYLTLRVQQRAD